MNNEVIGFAVQEAILQSVVDFAAENAALCTKLAAAQAERDELYETVAALGNQIAAMELSAAATRQDVVNLWYSIPDNQPLRCTGDDGEFIELWMDGGKLIMEDEREYRLEFPIGNTIALCRVGAAHAAT